MYDFTLTPGDEGRYDGGMVPNNTSPTVLDVTGLPGPVVEDLERLVRTLREKLGSQVVGAPAVGRRLLMGRFAELKLSIPKDHIDEAQQEAWAGFPREFPEPPKGS